ncbi:MAG: thymidine phosphorylase [Clostridia bacterium]|nr:thymidine phosphorylase [Clostridia bacterium]
MRMYDVIRKKRDGGELSDAEIAFFVDGFTKGEIPDYQASALLMAIFFRGMTERETVTLTDNMAKSGDTVDLSRFGMLSADKHSTGGVGDKTTLIVAPVVASLGGRMAKMSGRGLGHTGGTVDKLESIPGYRTSLSPDEFLGQVEKIGLSVIGQSGNLTPADKKLYALRDVTATVDSIPLITSSIMSKKLAAGSHNIVLDVKVGSGAFMKTPEDAETLAREMVKIGKGCGRNVRAVLSNMDVPLGSAVGNSLEVIEAANILKGADSGDLYEVSVILSAQLVSMVRGVSVEEAERAVREAIRSGAAFAKMKEWVSSQGGDVGYLDDTDLFPAAKYRKDVTAPRGGYIFSTDAEKIGEASVVLGAGRASKEDAIDHAAGILIKKKTGDRVEKGDVICTLLTNDESSLADAEKEVLSAVGIGDEKPDNKPLVFGIIS